MRENEALAWFAAGDEKAARRAFDALVVGARPFLYGYLKRTTGLTADSREDVVQDALSNVWRSRQKFRNEGVAAWYKYLKTVAGRCCANLYRRPQEVLQDGTVLAETAEGEYVDALAALMDAQEARTVRRQADILWLGLDTSFPTEVHTRRLLAAQLVYLDRLPWDRVLRLLGPAPPGRAPLTRAALDDWLSDAAVLRHLAFHTLYYDNDSLTRHILGLDAEVDLDALSDAAPERPGPGGWTEAETAVILWRYRYGMLFEAILQRHDCRLTRAAVKNVIVRSLACFPFNKEMDSLLTVLGVRGRSALNGVGLWQRLAFEYRYIDDLPYQDIQDRLQPAYRHVATAALPEISLARLNGWLGNGRLLESLSRVCRGLEAREDDA